MFSPIQTQRLCIRPFSAADLQAFIAYRNDPEVAIYQSWEPSISEDWARSFIMSTLVDRPGVPGRGYQFAVALLETNDLIGDLYMEVKTEDPRQGEIGFTLAREHQGKGYGFEAVRALLDYIFFDLKLYRVQGLCDARNTSSAALMERVGMRREGHSIKSFWFKGEYTDEYLYAILRDEWLEMKDEGRTTKGTRE